MNKPIPFLTHPEVTQTLLATLTTNGIEPRNLEDAIQDVHVKVLASFQNGAPVPSDLDAMKALCATVARHHAIDTLRRRRASKLDVRFTGDPERHALPEPTRRTRDPVDARRQLEVLRDLFREGKMPERGADILEGVAWGVTYDQLARELGISHRAVEGRLRTMRRLYRARMSRLGLWPGMDLPSVLVSAPRSLSTMLATA
jgi:RNA polymerase sigma factor (sigma-70 family)